MTSAAVTEVWLAQGPSFPRLVKGLASVLMLAVLATGLRVVEPTLWARLGPADLAVGAGLGALLLGSYIGLMRSRTAVSATHVRQQALWRREVALADVTQAKLIDIPALRWLIAPRLMVRVRGRGLFTFHAADPAVLAVFRQLGLGQPPSPR